MSTGHDSRFEEQVIEALAEVRIQVGSIKEQLESVSEHIRPNGICERARRKIDVLETNVNRTWWFVGGIAVMLVGVAGYIVRSGIVSG